MGTCELRRPHPHFQVSQCAGHVVDVCVCLGRPNSPTGFDSLNEPKKKAASPSPKSPSLKGGISAARPSESPKASAKPPVKSTAKSPKHPFAAEDEAALRAPEAGDSSSPNLDSITAEGEEESLSVTLTKPRQDSVIEPTKGSPSTEPVASPHVKFAVAEKPTPKKAERKHPEATDSPLSWALPAPCYDPPSPGVTFETAEPDPGTESPPPFFHQGMDVPPAHDVDRYEVVRDIGSGNFGVARLVKDKVTGELLAVKYIERGVKIDENVQREIFNHRMLRHPNIIQFKEVLLTPTHLAIVMEYASGGELFDRICKAGRFIEDEARFFFQQLISGVDYCHSQQICHRDLKLENTLLDGSPAPRLKICDFGYSKSSLLHSQPKSTVGTPAYIAPEVLSRKQYDGKIADVWSIGVTLYVMLVGAYPFEDPDDPRNFRKTIQRIMSVTYRIPDNVKVSSDCQRLLKQIFIANPTQRITIPEIRKHPWFEKNLPADLDNPPENFVSWQQNLQTTEEILAILEEARKPLHGARAVSRPPPQQGSTGDDMDDDGGLDEEDSFDELEDFNST
eukprot:jgi/Mesvir1/2206/Mv09851-RA.1